MATWVGSDVAKGTHRVCAVDEGGRVRLSRAVPNTQEGVDALVEPGGPPASAEPRALPGPVRVGLDVGGSIAAFVRAVLRADGVALVHVPGSSVERAAHGYSGGGRKSDP